ncbi:hypothetical protein N825_33995 [Skermanella stibiiresistens SB22]|uniref:Uncharacterized protein n=2 Tax=Skermanella TaxID=204447 RepID=W9H8D3_9PROT|nr:hypothetical protein N825_33995 [Skermanella stibiiresistens SB22]
MISKAAAKRLPDSRVEKALDSLAPLSTREEFISDIRGQWEEVRKRFLYIGRRLAEAHGKLGRAEYESLISGSDLPFGRSVAIQLRSVYEAVRDGRLQQDELPGSYATAYQVITLTDHEIDRARREGLVRPNLLRREIVEFKQRLRLPEESLGRREQRLRRLNSEKMRLISRLEAIEAEINKLNEHP